MLRDYYQSEITPMTRKPVTYTTISGSETFIQDESLAELHDYFASYLATDPEAYVCLYGSSSYRPTSLMSDIDMFIATNHTVPSNNINELANFIRDFHIRRRRKVDEEVPYANKIIYTSQERLGALDLSMFPDGHVVPIQKTTEYLAGTEIKQRLFLNAMTTPHYIIGDNVQKYQAEKSAAERALTLLGISMQSDDLFSIDDIYSSLCVGPNGEFGESHLGYKINYPQVGVYLLRILRQTVPALVKEGIIGSHDLVIFTK